MLKIRVINGPNLNLLGTREPQVYGNTTLESIENILRREAGEYGVKIEFFNPTMKGLSQTASTRPQIRAVMG